MKDTAMEWLIWIGTAITLLGCAGLAASVVMISRAKSAGLDDEALRNRIQKVIPVNLGSLFIATIGLMTVIVGLFLR